MSLIENILTDLQSENEELCEENEQLAQTLESMSEENKKLMQQIENLLKNNEDLKNFIIKQENEIMSLKEELKSKLETELQIQQDLERELKNSTLNDLLEALKNSNLDLKTMKINSYSNSNLESEYKELLNQYKALQTEPLNEEILEEIHKSYLNDLEAIFQELLKKYLHLVDLELKKN